MICLFVYTSQSTLSVDAGRPSPLTRSSHLIRLKSSVTPSYAVLSDGSITSLVVEEDDDPMNCSCIDHSDHDHASGVPDEDELLNDPKNCSCHADEAAATSTETESSTVRNGKYGLMVGLFLCELLFASLPQFVSAKWRTQLLSVLSICCSFASGLILGACFMHVLPEATENWAGYFAERGTKGLYSADNAEYPFAHLICMFTLFILILINSTIGRRMDEMGHGHSHGGGGHGHSHSHGHGHNHGHSHSHGHGHEEQIHHVKDQKLSSQKEVEMTPHLVQVASTTNDPHVNDKITSVTFHMNEDVASPTSMQRPLSDSPVHGHPDSVVGHNSTVEKSESESASETETETEGEQAPAIVRPSFTAQAWVFLFAMSFHSLLDGLALGAWKSSSGFYVLVATSVIHECMDGISLGMPLFTSGIQRKQAFMAFFFSAVMTPIGIGIGIAAAENATGSDAKLASAIVFSLSAGSFIFIALVEMLPGSLEDGKYIYLKMFLLFLGFSIISVIKIFHSHDHGSETSSTDAHAGHSH